MKTLRICIFILALGPSLFMTFDGLRALVIGDYVTPTSGPYAGQLGPWSGLVSAVGIPPRSTAMKVTFVVFGVAWLFADIAFLQRARWSAKALAIMAVATLWYLPVGTVVSVLILAGLFLLGRRQRTQ